MIRIFLKNKKIPLYLKLTHGFKLFEGHIAWATWPLLLALIGWLPAIFAGRQFSNSVMYYSGPRIAGIIFNLASFSLITTIVLSLCLLPRGKVRYSFWKKLGHAFEWLWIPLIAILFSAIPALDAQTRLMLGKYMKFSVTEKKR